MTPNRRQLDLKLFIASLDTALAHSEWLAASGMIATIWKMADEHKGEWIIIKTLMIAYVIQWMADTKLDPTNHLFFDSLLINGIEINKTFNISKKKKKSKRIIVDEAPVIPYLDLPLEEVQGDTESNED